MAVAKLSSIMRVGTSTTSFVISEIQRLENIIDRQNEKIRLMEEAIRLANFEPEAECVYCLDSALGNVYYDQSCPGCVARMTQNVAQSTVYIC